MPDYTPLDITHWSNVETGALPERMRGPFGPQALRGLPFDISLIQFDAHHHQPVKIPIPSPARWVIVAHQLRESYVQDGEPVGRVIAHYRFCFRDGEPVVVPIRERL